MEKMRIISLGAWCRPAYQIASYAQKNADVESLKGPFDWTITSFEALKFCLNPDFNIDQILETDKIVSSFARSGMCASSGLIFHHAIEPKSLETLGSFAKGEKIPETDNLRHIVEDAKGRFQHTFGALASLRSYDGSILFVRWQRTGHPDPEYPDAFKGETGISLTTALTNFLGHSRFHILFVKSNIINGVEDAFPDPITSLQANGKYIECSINERKGWNGDQTNSFRGDENSWHIAFDRTLSHLHEQGSI